MQIRSWIFYLIFEYILSNSHQSFTSRFAAVDQSVWDEMMGLWERRTELTIDTSSVFIWIFSFFLFLLSKPSEAAWDLCVTSPVVSGPGLCGVPFLFYSVFWNPMGGGLDFSKMFELHSDPILKKNKYRFCTVVAEELWWLICNWHE